MEDLEYKLFARKEEIIEGFNLLAQEIHNTAHEKGWYDKGEKEMDAIRDVVMRVTNEHPGSAELIMDSIVKNLKPYDRSDLEMMCLEHAEISEAVEARRKGNPVSEKIPPFTQDEEETADVVIRILDRMHKNNFNLGGAILAKMAYNKTRPYRHGGKLA